MAAAAAFTAARSPLPRLAPLWERSAEDQRFLEQFSGAPIERPPTRVIRKLPNSSNSKPAATGD